ncbi:MAG: carboxypeptidase-like regulatory domain-containing protein, partial [Planctomycetota bacterium]
MRRLLLALTLSASCATVGGINVAMAENIPTKNGLPTIRFSTDVYHSGWGYIAQDGVFRGQAILHDGSPLVSRVTLLKNGQLVSRAISNAEGNFSFKGLQTGMYELRCDSGQGVAAISFLLNQAKAEVAPMRVHCTSLSSEKLQQIIAQYWAPTDWGKASDIAYTNLQNVLDGRPMIQSQTVALSNGTLLGQLAAPEPANANSHRVMAFQGGEMKVQTMVEANGSFALPIEPGNWDIVVVGQGIAALNVEVVSRPERLFSGAEAPSTRLVSAVQQPPAAEGLTVPLILSDQEEVDEEDADELGDVQPSEVVEEIVEVQMEPAPMALPAGGMATSGGGAIGGGGGGG